jgi:hypothetical protein
MEEVHTEIWWENLRASDYLEDLGAGWMIILKRILKNILMYGVY